MASHSIIMVTLSTTKWRPWMDRDDVRFGMLVTAFERMVGLSLSMMSPFVNDRVEIRWRSWADDAIDATGRELTEDDQIAFANAVEGVGDWLSVADPVEIGNRLRDDF